MQVNENSLSSEASARLPWSQATTTIGTTELVENRPSRCRCRCFCRQQNHCWKSTPALGSAGDGRNFNRQTSGWRLLLFEFQGKWQKKTFCFLQNTYLQTKTWFTIDEYDHIHYPWYSLIPKCGIPTIGNFQVAIDSWPRVLEGILNSNWWPHIDDLDNWTFCQILANTMLKRIHFFLSCHS